MMLGNGCNPCGEKPQVRGQQNEAEDVFRRNFQFTLEELLPFPKMKIGKERREAATDGPKSTAC
jgi:hypothetical protein